VNSHEIGTTPPKQEGKEDWKDCLLTMLTDLNLTGNLLSYHQIEAIKAWPIKYGLQQICGMPIGQICADAKAGQLASLSLSNCKLGPLEAAIIKNVLVEYSGGGLTELNLSRNRLGRVGALEMADALRQASSSLRSLNLAKNNLLFDYMHVSTEGGLPVKRSSSQPSGVAVLASVDADRAASCLNINERHASANDQVLFTSGTDQIAGFLLPSQTGAGGGEDSIERFVTSKSRNWSGAVVCAGEQRTYHPELPQWVRTPTELMVPLASLLKGAAASATLTSLNLSGNTLSVTHSPPFDVPALLVNELLQSATSPLTSLDLSGCIVHNGRCSGFAERNEHGKWGVHHEWASADERRAAMEGASWPERAVV